MVYKAQGSFINLLYDINGLSLNLDIVIFVQDIVRFFATIWWVQLTFWKSDLNF